MDTPHLALVLAHRYRQKQIYLVIPSPEAEAVS